MQKFLIIALTACLLAEVSVAFPSAKDDSRSSESSEEELTARDKLFVEIIKDFSGLTDFILEKGVEIFEKVLKDPTIASVNTESMQKHKSKFNEFIKEAKEVTDKEEKKDNIIYNILKLFGGVIIMTDYIEVVDKYNTTGVENPSTEVVLIENALKKYDVDEIEEELDKKVNDTVEHFAKDVENYLKSLTPAEKEKETKMIDWFKKYYEEKDIDKKMDIFSDFLKLYSEEGIEFE